MNNYLKILRPQQWYKNFVVFVAILFSGNLFSNLIYESIFAFFSLCLLSGFTYVLNDIIDINKDRKHPEKKKRPLPSGKIKKNIAILYSVLLLLLGLYISFSINNAFFLVSLGFVLLGIFYSFYLKNIFIIDVLTVSANFVLRAILGAFAIGVMISEWLVLCTFLLALFLALMKRKSELNLLGSRAYKHRKVLKYYKEKLVDNFTIIITTTLLVSYGIYVIYHNRFYMTSTFPVSIYLLFRYLSFGYQKDGYKILGSPSRALKDNGILLGLILWSLLIILNLYVL